MNRYLKKSSIVVGVFLVLFVVGLFFYNHPKVSIEQQNFLRQCAEATRVQNEAYKADTLATTETFYKYKVPVYTGSLSLLNMTTSSREAKKFVTVINDDLKSEGINFARHYTLVGVGMTGWGMNYFLIDRITGKGVPFLYGARYVDTRADSSLLIINSKEAVFEDMDDVDLCGSTGTGYDDTYTDLRPYYYNWNGTAFIQLRNPAPINPFWTGYFQ